MNDGTIETEVDGIQTFLVKSSLPRHHAGLVFRVGWADETLPTRGITHLVEHLALHAHGEGDLHYNGSTADTFTHFHAEGDPEDLVRYLNGVCAELRSLPAHRLDVEKEILRVESNKRYRPTEPVWRFGAHGYGLSTFPELGLHGISAAQVQQWADTWFTRQNAVLWMTTDTLPDGLDLTLTEGSRRPFPTVTSALPDVPAFFVNGSDEIVLSSVVPRSTEASIFSGVLHLQLFRDLRQVAGYSYNPSAGYQPRDADDAMIHAYADLTGENHDAATGAFVDVLATMRLGASDPEFLRRTKRDATTSLSDPNAIAYRLPSHAMNALAGHANLDSEEYLQQVTDVDADDIARVGGLVAASALVQVPNRGIEWAGFAPAPITSEASVPGKRLYSRADTDDVLIVGKDGISREYGDSRSTVHFSDTVGMLAYPDGGRVLIAPDGFQVAVEPGVHPVTSSDRTRIDELVGAERTIPMPARAADDVPRASGPPRDFGGDPRVTVSREWFSSTWSRVTLAIVAFLIIRIIISLATGGSDDTDRDGSLSPQTAHVTAASHATQPGPATAGPDRVSVSRPSPA